MVCPSYPRPVSIVLIIFCLATILLLLRQKFDTGYDANVVKNKVQQICFVLFLSCLPITMIWTIADLDYRANLYPTSLSVIAVILLTFILLIKVIDLRQAKALDNVMVRFASTHIFEHGNGFNNQLYYYASLLGYLGMNFIFGSRSLR